MYDAKLYARIKVPQNKRYLDFGFPYAEDSTLSSQECANIDGLSTFDKNVRRSITY